MSIVDFLVQRSRHSMGLVGRMLITVPGAVLFLAGFPALVVWTAGFCRSPLARPQVASSAAVVCFCIGIPCVLWAVVWQLVRGKGTPVPVVPTKVFLSNGPYRFVRNPMMLGFFLYLLGWACLTNRKGGLAAALTVIGVLIMHIKYIEEKELEKRFGSAYRQYARTTPFLIPRWKKKV